MNTPEKPTKTYSVKFEPVLSNAFSAYLSANDITSSKVFRALVIRLLIENKFLPPTYKDVMENGGDKWAIKIARATPDEKIKIKRRRAEHAAKMRAAKAAKIKISGNINGSGIIIGSGNLQKNLPK